MANELTLRAEPRTVHGKKVKRLRREGLIPSVVYGPVVPETVSVTVNRREFEKFFNTNGHSTIFSLEWESRKQPVLIREVQLDPVTRAPLHVDFFAPNMTVVLRTFIPIVLHNLSSDALGRLQTILTEVEVEALPNDLPHQLDAEITNLIEVGDVLRVADLSVPARVTVITDGEELVASIVAETVEVETESEETTTEPAAEPAETES